MKSSKKVMLLVQIFLFFFRRSGLKFYNEIFTNFQVKHTI